MKLTRRFLISAQSMLMLLVGLIMVAPVSAADTLPPRPPAPTVVDTAGGTIKLAVNDTQVIADGTHTVVQWEDVNGDWQNVESWRATFDHTREIVWWVAPDDLGKGTFRWVVLDADDNELAVSETFSLPSFTWGPATYVVSWE